MKKLNFRKETIAQLQGVQMHDIKGGIFTKGCATIYPCTLEDKCTWFSDISDCHCETKKILECELPIETMER